MATSVKIKACGGLAPYSWAVNNQAAASLSATTGITVTVTCINGAPDTPVIVTVTDAVGEIYSLEIGNCGGCSNCVPGAVGNLPTTAACLSGALSIDNETVCVPSGTTSGGTSGCTLLCCPSPLGTENTPLADPPPCATPELQMVYNGAIAGLPKTGMLVRTRGSTNANTTGVGFIIDETDNSIKVYRFDGESIATGGTVVLTGATQGAGLYYWEPWQFGSDEWWGVGTSMFYMQGPSGPIFDTDLANFYTTNALAAAGMGTGGGLSVCLWGLKAGSEAQASWSAMAGECGLCYREVSVNSVDSTCTAACVECFSGLQCS